MPWQAPSGSIYKMVLWDTNILSEMTKRPHEEARWYIDTYSPAEYSPCITFYNLIELHRAAALFNDFVTLFCNYPLVLLHPHRILVTQAVLEGETFDYRNIVALAFIPGTSDLKETLQEWFCEPWVIELEKNWRSEEQSLLDTWRNNRKKYWSSMTRSANSEDADIYIRKSAPAALAAYDLHESSGEIDDFPGLKMSLYSQYYRIFNPLRQMSLQDVTDVKISAAAPFMDVVITERFQADLYRKVKDKVQRMSNMKIVTLKDLRSKTKPKK